MKRSLAAASLAAVLALTACSAVPSAQSVLGGAQTAPLRQGTDVLGGIPLVHLTLSLFDAPLPTAGAKVNIAFSEVALISSTGAVVPCATYPNDHVVDLLSLQNAAWNIDGNIPAGSYTGIRFFIDLKQSNIQFGPLKLPLAFPNGPTSMTADASLALFAAGGPPTNVTADFNVLQSFTINGTTVSMHPTIVAAVNAGTVAGKIVNADNKPVSEATVQAIDASGNVANVSVTGSDGKFRIHALAAGTYTIQVLNSYGAGASAVTASGSDAGASPSATATVRAGATTNLPTITD